MSSYDFSWDNRYYPSDSTPQEPTPAPVEASPEPEYVKFLREYDEQANYVDQSQSLAAMASDFNRDHPFWSGVLMETVASKVIKLFSK